MFEVGQDVWCVIHGKGYVETVTALEDSPCMVFVRFENAAQVGYNTDGSLYPYMGTGRVLFYSKPTVTGALVPPFQPKYLHKMMMFVVAEEHYVMGKVVDENEEQVRVYNYEYQSYNWVDKKIITKAYELVIKD